MHAVGADDDGAGLGGAIVAGDGDAGGGCGDVDDALGGLDARLGVDREGGVEGFEDVVAVGEGDGPAVQ